MPDGIETKLVGLHGIAVAPDRMRKLRPEVVEQLMESIRVQGLLHPILLRPSSEKPNSACGYSLIAGWHRLEAHRKLGLDAIRAEIRTGLDADKALLAEIDENLMRAELSPAEKALHDGARKKIYERLHPETTSVRERGGPGRGKKNEENESQNEIGLPAFVDDAAKQTGRSRATVARSATRSKHIPEEVLSDVVGTSLDKGEELDALGKLPAEQQQELADRAVAGEKVSARTELKKVQREEREHDLGQRQLALPDTKFGVIVEDYEWDFEVRSRETGMDRHAANHYPVSEDAHTAEEIVARTLDRFECAADDCVLFMWATVPHLAVALDVMELRGFRYVSSFAWGKDRIGTGYWSRNRHEVLLIGVKGKIPAPAPGTQWDSLIIAPVGEHSQKPEIFMEMIEAYFPTIPKIELNCRGVPRPGWTGWGQEMETEAAE